VSNAIRYDSLLVRDLAEELDRRLKGALVHSIAFDQGARRVYVRLEEFTLIWDLDPGRGGLARGPVSREKGNISVMPGSRIRDVCAPPDERMLEMKLDAESVNAGMTRSLVIELLTNRWNAFALGPQRRILSILRTGERAARGQLSGDTYRAPRLSVRVGARAPLSLDEWLRLLLPPPPRERRQRLLESVAWVSPLNADVIVGEAGSSVEPEALRAAHDRYLAIVGSDPRGPCLIDPEGVAQPYGTFVSLTALPEPGLLEAFEDALRRRGRAPPPTPGTLAEEAADHLLALIRQSERRMHRLRSELDGAAEEATTRRRMADLLMSQLHNVRRGDTHVDLDDFSGGQIRVALDPALVPSENAARLYDAARKRERAARTLPRMIERAKQERASLIALLERVRSGDVPPGELQALTTVPARRAGRPRHQKPLPYRRFRTTGGLEVRVGRGSASNDELTFHHSAPNDVWLHARDVAGAHVILRWKEREANPPARDLHEAAVLAALHSRARTAGTVPVDWTRRKYVRKPRKAPPGRVAIERARTVFVEPDEALRTRLRWDPLEEIGG
jgi:predicted ribosome quality control (RQC) complex YloA/Tae2 family protein